MKPSEMSKTQLDAYLKRLWGNPADWQLPANRAVTLAYGWCDYCPAFTYHDLDDGACPECVNRWAECPSAMPASRR